MNELQIFSKEGFGEIRTIELNGKIYFVGNDIAKVLEYAEPHKAVAAHCRGGINHPVIDSIGRAQETKIIPEGDLYRLIIKAADQSINPKIKEKAEEFEGWIFDEVLPSIRQTGTYSISTSDIPTLTAATGYIRELRRAMEKQGSTPKEIVVMIEKVCKRFNLPLPPNFVKEPPFEQLTLTINLGKA